MANVLEISQVEKAVIALKECISKSEEKKDVKDLFSSGGKVALQFSVKKVFIDKRRTVRIVLPHPMKVESPCLFVKDIDKKKRDYSDTIAAYTELLQLNGITEKFEIIPLKKLKTEYTEYNAKWHLSNLHDLFLADSTIIRLLPAFLGSTFIKQKRFPIQVRLEQRDLRKEFDRVFSTTQCELSGRGSCSQVVVGTLDQDTADIAKNILVCFEKIQKEIPGGLQNIRNVQIKCETSLAVPLYISFDSKNDVVLPQRKRKEVNVEAEDVATVLEGNVLIRNGRIEIIKPGETIAAQAPRIKRKAGKMSKPDKPVAKKIKTQDGC